MKNSDNKLRFFPILNIFWRNKTKMRLFQQSINLPQEYFISENILIGTVKGHTCAVFVEFIEFLKYEEYWCVRTKCVWNTWCLKALMVRLLSAISPQEGYGVDTEKNGARTWNQSMVQQLMREGNCLRRLRNASPMGENAMMTWRFSRQRFTKKANRASGLKSAFLSPAWATGRTACERK